MLLIYNKLQVFLEKLNTEGDFNKIIEIKAREAKRVKIYMDDAN